MTIPTGRPRQRRVAAVKPIGPRRRPDDGRVSVFLAIAFTGLLIVIGVIVDAAGQLRTLLRAENIAAEAARAAGQAVDSTQVISGGSTVADPVAAGHAAAGYVSEAAAAFGQPTAPTQVVVTPDGTQVHITVTLTYRTQVLWLIGITERQVTAAATATLVSD